MKFFCLVIGLTPILLFSSSCSRGTEQQDGQGKSTYTVKITDDSVKSYAGKTCFVGAISADLSDPNKLIFEKITNSKKTFGVDLKSIELTLTAAVGSTVELTIRGKAYEDPGSITSNDQREDAEQGCVWGNASFVAGQQKEVQISELRIIEQATVNANVKPMQSENNTSLVSKAAASGVQSDPISATSPVPAASSFDSQITGQIRLNWVTKTTSNGLASNTIYRVAVSGRTVYAATDKGLSISRDSGNTWVTKGPLNGLAGPSIFDIFVEGNNVYAITVGGLSISTDGGNTWVTATSGNEPGANWLVEGVYVADGKVYAATNNGLSISNQ